MSGHSHWATIKHKKAAADSKKNKVFSKHARAVMVAAKQGGGDPDTNIKLQYAVEAARADNMPRDNIERAIKRATGEMEGVRFEEVTYEGYGPGGVAFLVETLTDNRNRTASDIRKTFETRGGKMGAAGSVGYLFERKGVIRIPANTTTEDDLMMAALDAGADNLTREGDHFVVTTGPTELDKVRKALAGKFKIEAFEMMMIPKDFVKVDAEVGRRLLDFMDVLDELDDVQKIFSNFELPETVAP
ncbi:MAG: YebC/PmpR family DNA-binding transcriptional regulator [Planctomycetes bacterium]|nr:YebC/PmpR family DNA-binding transcriptional regulator [Planctomycetota bacterium]